jgi:hypothetical protein
VLKKIITWAIVLFIIFFVATDPADGSHVVQHAYNGLHDAAGSLAGFVNSL